MQYLFNGTIVAFAELLIELKLIHANGKFGTGGEIDAFSMEDGFTVEVEGSGWIARWYT